MRTNYVKAKNSLAHEKSPSARGRRLNVAFLDQDCKLGGAEFNLLYLFKYLDRNRFAPLLLVPFAGELERRALAQDVPVRLLGHRRFYSTSAVVGGRKVFNPVASLADCAIFLPVIHRLASMLRSEAIDVLLTNAIISHIYGGLAARWAGVSCVWFLQDIMDARLGLGLVPFLYKNLARRLPHKIVAVSGAVRAAWAGHGISPKITVIHNATDTDEYKPGRNERLRAEFGVPPDGLLVGIIGRLTPWKGHKVFLEAAARVGRVRPGARFLIVGDTVFDRQTYQEELRGYAASLGIQNQVLFTGFRTDIPEVYQALDVGVIASTAPDPSPRVAYDMMASGLPIVATDVGGLPEIIADRETGLLVRPGDPDQLAEVIVNISNDKALAEQLGRSARQRALAKFSIKAWVRNIERVLEEATL